MKRREFLTTSCAVGLTSLTGSAFAQDPTLKRPDESEAAYRQRLARIRAAQAARERADGAPRQLPGESDAAYRQRLARVRATQAARERAGDAPKKLPGESEAAYRQRLASLRRSAAAARSRASARAHYELRRYEIENEAQKAGFDKFLSDTAIPALNRLGHKPIGVFYPWEGISPIYILIPHRSPWTVATLTQQLGDDPAFMEKGAAFLDAPADKPAYKRMTSTLMIAFEGMPQLETPIKSPGRVLQLRIYESPSTKTGQKKIEMFNNGEIDIFRKTGLNPVFFGETLIGDKMPNLTYMLVFNNMDERKANWRRFVSSPEWKALSSIPEYADKKILCGITNLFLKPAAYSQI